MTGIRTPSRMSTKKKVVIVAAILISATLAGWLTSRFFFSPEKPLVEDTAPPQGKDFPLMTSAEIKVPVTLFYPSESGLTKEEKTLAGSSVPVKLAESLLQEYFKGFKSDMKNTQVKGVYEDRNKILYVDLSDDFRKNAAGSARFEYYLLKSIYQTLVTNVSEVSDVKILVEGREIETVGGHMITLFPLRESVWF